MPDYRDEYRKEWDAEMREARQKVFPKAFCHACGWDGPRQDMLCGSNFLDGMCPECGSEQTELLPAS
jgi:hypothetical protein